MSKKPLSTNEMADTSNDFESIYESNAPLIYRFMFWRTKDEMLAQDLTSNVFEKAWRTRKSFTGGSAKAWLFRIARTTLIDHWRKVKDLPDDGHVISEAVSDIAELDQALDRQMVIAKLQEATTKLPKDMRAVVELRFIQGKSARETGAQLNISEANVRVIQYRALQKLRNYIQ
jgi:RNA polymerase sigma-70 factor (ECF subfamily)